MRTRILSLLLLLCPALLPAQSLTGIWRGTFVQGVGALKDQYKYEVQINQAPNKALNGVTYSYLNTAFFGKAVLQGIFMDKTGDVIVKESKLVELKTATGSQGCLMTCYLTYHKDGNEEYMEGSYSSVNVKDSGYCGGGRVYLKRVPESEFGKEEFLLPKDKNGQYQVKGIKPGAADALVSNKRPQTTYSNTPKTNTTPKTSTSKTPTKPLVKQSQPLAGNKPKPNTQSSALGRSKTDAARVPATTIPVNPDSLGIVKTEPPAVIAPVLPQVQKPQLPVPSILKERENKLVRTIVTHSNTIKIQLYDNGEIDDDTITVYHNNAIVAFKQRLSHTPITINITADENDPLHELVMVADNMGTIPPNTALMVILADNKRYELTLTSTEQKNAKVLIKFEKG